MAAGVLAAILLAAGLARPTAAPASAIVQFADPNLEAAVRLRLGIPAPSPITDGDMLNLDLVDARDAGISDLNGLEWAHNLEWLSLGGNDVDDLSPVAGLTRLWNLSLYGNRISDLTPLASMARLTFLGLGANRITDVGPLAGLVSLRDLWLDQNQITDITALGGLPGLRLFVLADNPLHDVSPLAGLARVRAVALNDCRVEDLAALTGLLELGLLDVRGNPLGQEAYDSHLPQILANNPGMDLRYDPIPEPTSCVLLLAGTALGLAVRRRRP